MMSLLEVIRTVVLLMRLVLLCGGDWHSVVDCREIPLGTTKVRLLADISADELSSLLKRVEVTVSELEVKNVAFTSEHYRVVANLPHLKAVEFDSVDPQRLYAEFSKIDPPRHLETLRICVETPSKDQMTREELSWIFNIKTLRCLILDVASPVIDTESFETLPCLENLSLPLHGEISDDALAGLSKCRKLQILSVARPDRLSAQNFKDIATIPNLSMLQLKFATKTDHFQLLKSAKHLEWLILSRDHLSDEELESVTKSLKGVKIVCN